MLLAQPQDHRTAQRAPPPPPARRGAQHAHAQGWLHDQCFLSCLLCHSISHHKFLTQSTLPSFYQSVDGSIQDTSHPSSTKNISHLRFLRGPPCQPAVLGEGGGRGRGRGRRSGRERAGSGERRVSHRASLGATPAVTPGQLSAAPARCQGQRVRAGADTCRKEAAHPRGRRRLRAASGRAHTPAGYPRRRRV